MLKRFPSVYYVSASYLDLALGFPFKAATKYLDAITSSLFQLILFPWQLAYASSTAGWQTT